MVEFTLVMSTKDGKSYQKKIKSPDADELLKKKIGDTVTVPGWSGYEFEVTGGSDKCGFPMRKGIQQARKMIFAAGEGVGFSGKNRNNKRQKGLAAKKTVCGEMVNSITHQINLKVLKQGTEALVHEPAEKKG